MPELEGKVAFITGAARGQGRSHALTLAKAGADIIAVDICDQIDTVAYPMASPADLDETRRLVEDQDRRIIARQADVRSLSALQAVVTEGVAEFGRLDIVCANAGIAPGLDDEDHPSPAFANVIDVNLTGVWNTVKASEQALIDGGRGGAIVLTSSTAGFKAVGAGTSAEAYVASKHGVVGLMRVFAVKLAKYSIRVNTVHPTGVATPMIQNAAVEAWIAANAEALSSAMTNLLPVELIQPEDVSNAILWLVSDAARYVTGATLPVDAGFVVK
jgi:SDR family mycofactocin-dependent oxidoreductase